MEKLRKRPVETAAYSLKAVKEATVALCRNGNRRSGRESCQNFSERQVDMNSG